MLPPPAIIIVLCTVAAIAAFWDMRTRRIPNWLCLSGIVAGFALNAWLAPSVLEGLKTAGIGMLVGFGIYFLLHLIRAMGAGDVKFMAAVGSLTGWHEWMYIFVVSVILGAIAGVILAMSKGRLRRTFSNVGFIVSELTHFRAPYIQREELDVKSDKGLRMPHGVAIAAGIFLTIGWQFLQSR